MVLGQRRGVLIGTGLALLQERDVPPRRDPGCAGEIENVDSDGSGRDVRVTDEQDIVPLLVPKPPAPPPAATVEMVMPALWIYITSAA
jgi:hypothetical protein